MTKPKVFKMAGVWIWACDDGKGPIGGDYRPEEWRDPWTAALAAATGHAVRYHSTDPGEVIGRTE